MTLPQILMLEKAANVLLHLEQRIVFTGGATIALYLDEISAQDVRPTIDVDCVLEISSKSSYYRLADNLRQLGLQESHEPGDPLCRWKYQDLILDIMPTDPEVLGFSNSWYKSGMNSVITFTLPCQISIFLFSTPYMLAAKIEAFLSRGEGNFYMSHDFEDIVLLLDGCPNLELDIAQADDLVKSYLQVWFTTTRNDLELYAPAHLSPDSKSSGREQLLLQRIQRLAESLY
ncbi:MAG: nucleotidyl transferase AbiEii/AbiGii toxin family protein [Thermosynechococcaceae cyanobacterium]